MAFDVIVEGQIPAWIPYCDCCTAAAAADTAIKAALAAATFSRSSHPRRRICTKTRGSSDETGDGASDYSPP